MTYNNSNLTNCQYIEKIDWQHYVIPVLQFKQVEEYEICGYCRVMYCDLAFPFDTLASKVRNAVKKHLELTTFPLIPDREICV